MNLKHLLDGSILFSMNDKSKYVNYSNHRRTEFVSELQDNCMSREVLYVSINNNLKISVINY